MFQILNYLLYLLQFLTTKIYQNKQLGIMGEKKLRQWNI